MSAYEDLCGLARERAILSTTAAILGWDQETHLPAAAVPYRARQLSTLSGKIHALSTSDQWRERLEGAEENPSGDPVEAANLREFRHHFDRATKLPRELVERASEAASLAKAAWAEARENAHFPTFAPHLDTLLSIAREKAECWGYADEPYDAVLENYERGARTSEVDAVFSKLRKPISEIARAAVARSAAVPADALHGSYPVAAQKTLNREIAESLGFDFEAGRIDTVTHPFCTHLGPHDTRLTTRYDEADFTSSLFGVMHEAGHGLYDQGLPEDHHGLPSGDAISLGIHESQSRLWENHVGRSRPFWQRWLPRAAELFPSLAAISLDDFLGAINRAEFSCIRVDADEATYDLHILLRFSLERRMLNGDLAVEDIPAAWNAEFEELFGFVPPDDSHGCLQDIHWSMGGLGYFATYSLGNLNAAQLFATAMQDAPVAAGFARADYLPLLAWMRDRVHTPGSTLLPQDLMKAATGAGTHPEPYLAHLRERFLAGAPAATA
ncbi:MAG: carboxypeptidase M32 [Akkermansiaceae bacterium]|nr:carboxypeptidase M32 [Akkermansiaceae bacterium]